MQFLTSAPNCRDWPRWPGLPEPLTVGASTSNMAAFTQNYVTINVATRWPVKSCWLID